MENRDHCVVCQRSLRRLRRHDLNSRFLQNHANFVEHIVCNIEPPQEMHFDGTRAICHSCWHRINSISNENQSAVTSDNLVRVSATIHVPEMVRAANTSRRCMINNCQNVQLRQVPNSIKVYLLSYFHFYIPDHAQICQRHLITIPVDELTQHITRHLHEFGADSLINIVNIYTLALESRRCLFDDINEISEGELHFWTGLNHKKFNQLLNQIPSLQQLSNSPEQDLGIYLCKIRTGEPSTRLSSVFNISRRSIDRKVHLARSCLLDDFMPLHIGLNHITRNEVIARNIILPNYIFGSEESPKAIIILMALIYLLKKALIFCTSDAPIAYINTENLIKPFIIVCADGHIIEIVGPYAATTTDANIMTKILENDTQPVEDGAFNYLFEEGDVLILDRGFRDAIPTIESYGYNPFMPPTKRPGETQLSTIEANKSRVVTICRWVVEAVNGKFKRDFKIIRQRIFNRASLNMFKDFKIAGAINNCFQEPFKDSLHTNEFVEAIRLNMNKPNILADYIEENNINHQRVPFVRLDVDNENMDFPELAYEDLIIIAIGTYHVKLARSYCSEHIKRTGVYEIELIQNSERVEINNEQNHLIRCKIQSRHVRNKT